MPDRPGEPVGLDAILSGRRELAAMLADVDADVRAIRDGLDKHGRFDDRGDPRPAVGLLAQFIGRSLKLRKAIRKLDKWLARHGYDDRHGPRVVTPRPAGDGGTDGA